MSTYVLRRLALFVPTLMLGQTFVQVNNNVVAANAASVSVTYGAAETAGDPQTSVITEVERYCVWPGQACSYMLGKLEFLKQRERAQKTLGGKFDIRKFHDAMLLDGAVPLSLMSGLADRYIAST